MKTIFERSATQTRRPPNMRRTPWWCLLLAVLFFPLLCEAQMPLKQIKLGWDAPGTNENVIYWRLYIAPTNRSFTNIVLTFTNQIDVTGILSTKSNGWYATWVSSIGTYGFATNRIEITNDAPQIDIPSTNMVFGTDEIESAPSESIFIFWKGVPPRPKGRITIFPPPPLPPGTVITNDTIPLIHL